jgi:hypothetical protein
VRLLLKNRIKEHRSRRSLWAKPSKMLAVGCDAKVTRSGLNETTTVTNIYEADNVEFHFGILGETVASA